MMERIAVALSIAGSDSSAGAGVQADLKTFSALGVYGATAITAITAQNTLGVRQVHLVPADSIAAQIDAVFCDLSVKAVKTGMLGNEAAVVAAADLLAPRASRVPVVVDPVMVATSGQLLLEPRAVGVVADRLLPLATLLTPNLHEAATLLAEPFARTIDEMAGQAQRLRALGPSAVLLKGGHRAGDEAVDLYFDGSQFRTFSLPRIETPNTHGTGCTLAAAITAFLVKGLALEDAITRAKAYLQGALERAKDRRLGSGPGPVAHFPIE
jgi:hydroxymethylpyrimidine/phosphomethylpyrimidine kinase